MENSDILIIGGDTRYSYLALMLKEKGNRVNQFLVPGCTPAASFMEVLKKYLSISKYIICPIPFSRDGTFITTTGEYADVKLSIEFLLSSVSSDKIIIGGMFSNYVKEIFDKQKIQYFDLMKCDKLTLANAALTAEGLLKDIIGLTPFSVCGSNILILGYGRCGQSIADILCRLGAKITVLNRNTSYDFIAMSKGFLTVPDLKADDKLFQYDLIINTIPENIFTIEHLKYTKPDVYLFDIASGNGGFTTDVINKTKSRYKKCPGIPGNTAPKTAATFICKVLEEDIK